MDMRGIKATNKHTFLKLRIKTLVFSITLCHIILCLMAFTGSLTYELITIIDMVIPHPEKKTGWIS